MANNSEMSRRRFLATSGTIGVGAAALTTVSPWTNAKAKVLGANESIRIAVCGCRGRGKDHIKMFPSVPEYLPGMPPVTVAAICDVDQNVIAQRMTEIEQRGQEKPQVYSDIRKLLEDNSIDAVTIATPHHWHALAAIWSMQAGKHVYVEKPCSHNWWEGRQLCRAAEHNNRLVQHGTQARSSPSAHEAMEHLRNGLIGEIYMARGLCYKRRNSIGHTPPSPVPAGVDYNLWTGPAPEHAFTKNKFHYNWHWFWAFGNGDIGNQGVHQVDMARRGLGVALPNKITATGGHFVHDDDQETPNLLSCNFQYDLPGGKRKIIEFEVRNWITHREADIGTPKIGENANGPNSIGNIFYGSNGYMAVGDEDSGNAYQAYLGPEMNEGPHAHEGGSRYHFSNFIKALVSGKQEDLTAPIEEGHISATMCHLANASYRLGRTLNFDPEKEEVIGDDEANRLLREEDRGYRAPFVIPENF
jgi:predicted dehydrogenase